MTVVVVIEIDWINAICRWKTSTDKKIANRSFSHAPGKARVLGNAFALIVISNFLPPPRHPEREGGGTVALPSSLSLGGTVTTRCNYVKSKCAGFPGFYGSRVAIETLPRSRRPWTGRLRAGVSLLRIPFRSFSRAIFGRSPERSCLPWGNIAKTGIAWTESVPGTRVSFCWTSRSQARFITSCRLIKKKGSEYESSDNKIITLFI